MTIIRETDPKNLPALALSYRDARLPELLFRYRARNFPAHWMSMSSSAGLPIAVRSLIRII